MRKPSASKRSRSVMVALYALTAAAVMTLTLVIQIPVPATGGYLNFGDIAIFLFALLFGSRVGAFAGGFGSALADLAGGYGVFAPFTLFIKGAEGFLAGYLAVERSVRRDLLAWAAGATAMVLGYFIIETLFFGGVPAALVEIPSNLLQVFSGAVVGIPLAQALRKAIPAK
ncbi:MAG: ECF transporter S component [Aigarchaeota archaeon]|nr:ECF transporter S component [Aigarchaeota archaeon]